MGCCRGKLSHEEILSRVIQLRHLFLYREIKKYGRSKQYNRHRKHIQVQRYADDIVITDRALNAVKKAFYLNNEAGGFQINEQKTNVMKRGELRYLCICKVPV